MLVERTSFDDTQVVRRGAAMTIAHVSTFPETRCGIALYAADLVRSLPEIRNVNYALHYGANLSGDVAAHANAGAPAELENLARTVSDSDCDVVSLQYEFGIWGGKNLLDFLRCLDKPIVSTLHTTYETDVGRGPLNELLVELMRRSARVVVLSKLSKQTAIRLYGREPDKVVVIPHGIPAIPYSAPSPAWCANPLTEVCNFISLGFFNPSKGFEIVLTALSRLKKKGMRFSYIIAGGPQPQFDQQRGYRDDIFRLVQKLELADSVFIHDRFLSKPEQINLIQAAHAGIFAYQDPEQASSGTVPMVLGAGRPVICTPFQYAQAKSREPVYIVLADGFDVDAVERALLRFWRQAASLTPTSKRIYDYTRAWLWSAAGWEYDNLFRAAMAEL